MNSRPMPILILGLLLIGFMGYVYSQNVVTTTTTRIVTIPATTYTTSTIIAGTRSLLLCKFPHTL